MTPQAMKSTDSLAMTEIGPHRNGGILRAMRSSRLVRTWYARFQRRFGGGLIRCNGKGHRVELGDSRISGGSISIAGSANTLVIGPGTRLWNVKLELHGSGLTCRIGSNCRMRGGTLVIEDIGSRLEVGDGTTLIQAVIVASEGGRIRLGGDCLVAAGADIRNSDGHSILNDAGKRLNPASNIEIGRHVWLGLGSQVLKGVTMGEGSIAAARALVNADVPRNSVAAGIPARVVRDGIQWDHRRL